MAYGPVGKFGWAVGIKAPLGMVLAATTAAGTVTFSITALTIVMVGLFMVNWHVGRVHLQAREAEKEGGSGTRQRPKLKDSS